MAIGLDPQHLDLARLVQSTKRTTAQAADLAWSIERIAASLRRV